MSAAVCGNKRRSFFDDLANGATSSPVNKRLRCSSSSPVRLSSVSPPRAVSVFDQLRTAFPDVDAKVLERTLEECGNDLDSAIKSINQHFSGSQDQYQLPGKGSDPNTEEGGRGGGTTESLSGPTDIPVHGAQWVELLVREIMSATSIDDARARATCVLESLENSIRTRTTMEAAETFQKDYTTVKGQMEALIRDNTILKRAVSIQHERQKEHDDRNHELQYLKQALSQYQEQLRQLELQNYALQMHLKQAEQRSSIPRHFNPDIF